MHTFEGKHGTVFQFSSDFSGPAYIISKKGEEIKIEGEDLEEFIEEIRARKLESLVEDVE